jgi:photosystem II stability/assembly factor-like uncharacterized protein
MRIVRLIATGLVAAAAALAGTTYAAAAPVGFAPGSTSWPSASHGWVLGWVPCGSNDKCARLYQTMDGGKTWAQRTAPPIKPSEFGDPTRLVIGYLDGSTRNPSTAIITNGTVTYASYDGARTWKAETFGIQGQVSVGELDASTKDAYALVTSGDSRTTQLYRSPLGKRAWTKATPARTLDTHYPSGDIATRGTEAIVTIGSEAMAYSVWTTADGSKWTRRDPSCFEGAVAQVAVPAVGKLFALCSWAPGRGFMRKELKFSDTGEAFWTAGFPADTGLTSDFAAASAEVAAVGSTGGDEAFVQLTTDGGYTWRTTLAEPETGPVRDLAFTDAKRGVLVAGYAELGTSKLFRTTDGGRTWTEFAP